MGHPRGLSKLRTLGHGIRRARRVWTPFRVRTRRRFFPRVVHCFQRPTDIAQTPTPSLCRDVVALDEARPANLRVQPLGSRSSHRGHPPRRHHRSSPASRARLLSGHRTIGCRAHTHRPSPPKRRNRQSCRRDRHGDTRSEDRCMHRTARLEAALSDARGHTALPELSCRLARAVIDLSPTRRRSSPDRLARYAP